MQNQRDLSPSAISLLRALQSGIRYVDWYKKQGISESSARGAKTALLRRGLWPDAAQEPTWSDEIFDEVKMDELPELQTVAELVPRFMFPGSPAASATAQILQIDGDYGLISDLHIPYHDPAVIERFCAECWRHGIKKFAILGDFFDGNQFHPKRGKDQHHSRRFQDDVVLAEEILAGLLSCFDSGVFLQGNHDEWFSAHMRGQVDPAWMLEKLFNGIADRVQFTGYQQAILTSGDQEIRLAHGRSYSQGNPLGVAKTLSAKFEQPVVIGHQHHHEAGYSRSGRQVLCMGGSYDPTRMAYIHESPGGHPKQTRGFAIVKNGTIYDWSEKDFH